MNEFINQTELRCRTRLFQRRAFASHWIRQAHLKLPNINDLARRMEWAATHDLSSISHANRQWAKSTFNPDLLKSVWSKNLLDIGPS